jgi:uncharacterized protein (TIGR00730 family)
VDDKRLLSSSEHALPENLISIAEEFRAGFAAVESIDRPAVSIFGSARTAEDTPAYQAARTVGRHFGERGWAVITGGGPGIMEAANRGAFDAGGLSIGCNIELPFEQGSNPYLTKGLKFKYFFVRKMMFVKYSLGFIIFPGGFGTLDELFEALTLVQTTKVTSFPIVLVGSDYWNGLLDWLRTSALRYRAVSEKDIDLLQVTDDPAEAVRIIVEANGR